MAEVTGTVEAVSHKFDKLSLKVNDVWYATKKEYAPAFEINRGDEVQFDDGGKKYLSKVRKLTSSSGATAPANTGTKRTPGFPVGVDTKDRSIVRQNSLSHAVKLVSTVVGPTTAKTFEEREKQVEALANLSVEVARIFEGYSSGDDDAAEAAALLEAKEEKSEE
jgi:hypothetical protein